MKYSIIVPVFNRPDEVGEFLDSLSRQTVKDFEVVIVEDGSQRPCKDVCDGFTGKLDIKYFMKENSGPGQSRNYGAERASGDYITFVDSDDTVQVNTYNRLIHILKRHPEYGILEYPVLQNPGLFARWHRHHL